MISIVAGSSNTPLVRAIATRLRKHLVSTELSVFSNGERRVRILDDLNGHDVFIIQTMAAPVDGHIMETLLLADAAKRRHARSISFVIPWLGYSLQDKAFHPGDPVSAKVVASLFSHIPAKIAILMDIHDEHVLSYFDTPVSHVSAMELMLDDFRKKHRTTHSVVAFPDFGAAKRWQTAIDRLDLPVVMIGKRRNHDGTVKITGVLGDVANKNVLLLDDGVISGNTLVAAAHDLRTNGASAIHCYAIHAILPSTLNDPKFRSAFDTCTVSNSFGFPSPVPGISVIDVAPLFADAIRKSVS